jgi:hypothetical protein
MALTVSGSRPSIGEPLSRRHRCIPAGASPASPTNLPGMNEFDVVVVGGRAAAEPDVRRPRRRHSPSVSSIRLIRSHAMTDLHTAHRSTPVRPPT